MAHDMVLVRYGEIGLKGKNRPFFERKLEENIKSCLESQGIGFDSTKRIYGRILVWTSEDVRALERVFGIVSFSPAIEVGESIEEALPHVDELIDGWDESSSFRVSCQRLDKSFPKTSQEVAVELGAYVQEKTGAPVDLEGFDNELVVEIIRGKVYLLTDTLEGPGGLPVGSEGDVLALIDDTDGEKAALLALKRGCHLDIATTTDYSTDLLDDYLCGLDIKRKKLDAFEELPEVIGEFGSQALFVGDRFGSLKDYPVDVLVLRPLVGDVR